jgi:hypothetical protein
MDWNHFLLELVSSLPEILVAPITSVEYKHVEHPPISAILRVILP